MKNSFIEVYDNALPDDVCNSLVSLFDRENEVKKNSFDNFNSPSSVKEAVTAWGKRKDLYSALELKLSDENYFYRDVISDLDYIINQKIFKYKVWSDDLNQDLIKEVNEPITNDKLGNYIYRYGKWSMKKYRHPEDGYNAWHTDWTKDPYAIERVLSVQFYLNDVKEGGETEFLHQGIKIKPKKGRLVVWPVGFTHTHRGNKPISGDKYIVSSHMTTYF